VSFAGEPGRDDGSLPPVNIEIPDDARELARDVLAYHREQRARHRRERLSRFLGPFARAGLIRHGAVLPLIATCLAIALLAGAMLSVVTISPASAPTLGKYPGASATPTSSGANIVSSLPEDAVLLGGQYVQVRTLTSSVLVLIPPNCGCGDLAERVAAQGAEAHVAVYFVFFAGTSNGLAGMNSMTAQYGDGVARTVYDDSGLLYTDFQPGRLTALLVRKDATVDVRRTFPPGFDLGPALRALKGTH